LVAVDASSHLTPIHVHRSVGRVDPQPRQIGGGEPISTRAVLRNLYIGTRCHMDAVLAVACQLVGDGADIVAIRFDAVGSIVDRTVLLERGAREQRLDAVQGVCHDDIAARIRACRISQEMNAVFAVSRRDVREDLTIGVKLDAVASVRNGDVARDGSSRREEEYAVMIERAGRVP
jgi:hypothetical protein